MSCFTNEEQTMILEKHKDYKLQTQTDSNTAAAAEGGKAAKTADCVKVNRINNITTKLSPHK